VEVRTCLLVLAASLLCACASGEGEHSNGAKWTELKADTRKAASATARGAEATADAIGDSVGTAYRGVKNGYQAPENDAYGSYPRDYVKTIRKHMLRFEGVKETARFRFGKPVRAYLNKGLFRGGEIEWQGWVVDLDIETKTRLGQPQVDAYVVTMKDGDIVEVIEKAYAGAFQRVDGQPSVPAAPGSR
jgi:hypothetical protein